jgi:hypothetical protein
MSATPTVIRYYVTECWVGYGSHLLRYQVSGPEGWVRTDANYMGLWKTRGEAEAVAAALNAGERI